MIAIPADQRAQLVNMARRSMGDYGAFVEWLADAADNEAYGAIRGKPAEREVLCGRAQVLQELHLAVAEIEAEARGDVETIAPPLEF